MLRQSILPNGGNGDNDDAIEIVETNFKRHKNVIIISYKNVGYVLIELFISQIMDKVEIDLSFGRVPLI